MKDGFTWLAIAFTLVLLWLKLNEHIDVGWFVVILPILFAYCYAVIVGFFTLLMVAKNV